MADVSPQGPTAADVAAMIATAIAGLPTSFVNGGSAMNINQLNTNFPASAPYNGLYARVNNLYNGVSDAAVGGIDDIVRCRYDVAANAYRWVPQREAYNGIGSQTSGSVTLTSLVSPPTMRMTATLLGSVSISPSTVGAYIGQKYRVINNSALGAFAMTITGLIGSNLTLLGGNVANLEFGSTGWFNAGN